jgi:hypothetical protein
MILSYILKKVLFEIKKCRFFGRGHKAERTFRNMCRVCVCVFVRSSNNKISHGTLFRLGGGCFHRVISESTFERQKFLSTIIKRDEGKEEML